MGFEDLLREKLGPMRDLLKRPSRDGRTDRPDPAKLWYRRAAGLEVQLRPHRSWAEAEIGRVDADASVRLSADDAAIVAGLTEWRRAEDLGVSAEKLWGFVEADLLFFAHEAPAIAMTGTADVIGEGVRIARRRSVWPTLAVETAVQIAPMPFMPRGRDLQGAAAVGARFASLERGHEVYAVNLLGDAAIGGVLRRVLPLLNGTHTAEQIVATFERKHRSVAEKLLRLMDRFALLEAMPDPTAHFVSFEDVTAPQVTWLGHAGVLLQTPTTNILFDPLFFSASDPEEPHLFSAKFDPRTLPRIDGVVLTHPDNDHLNPNSLSLIATTTKIVVPRTGYDPPPYQVDTLGIVRVLGFTNVDELDPWSTTTIGDVKITGCPFIGESWGLPLATLTYLAEADGASIFVSADAAEMPEVYDALRERDVQLAFMGVSGCAEAHVMPRALGYGNFYADWIPEVQRNEWVRHCAGPKEAVESIARMKPRFAFGYAAGGASYIRTAYSDVGSHDELARRVLERDDLETSVVAMPIGIPVSFAGLGDLPPLSKPC